MPAKVSKVLDNSIAQELDIKSGDEILSIDEMPLKDMIDYNFMIKSEFITLEIKKENGEIEVIELEKDYDENLGIVFESAVFDKIKLCLNHCIFCFVDQQPKGLRPSLYVKDDDYRLSYLQGTYITLTNLKDEDKKRIEMMHLGPFYVSVHTTNPELRVKMLRNPNAKNIIDNLKWLKKCEIPIHAQIVLCPSYNDGDELERTLSDLEKFNVLSVAIVPVGITDFRENKLKTVTKQIAKETIEIASQHKRVCCSDEFFLLAEEQIPPTSYYGNFVQLDDGVGSIRYLLDNFYKLKLPTKLKENFTITFATSYAAKNAIEEIAQTLNKIENLSCKVLPVKSNYWGGEITVAGLITSDDLIKALADDESDVVVIPTVMLKSYSEDFLDGKTLNDVKKSIGKEFFVEKENYSFKGIVEMIQKRA